ncbi:folate-binding protein YgfZ [Aestuariicella hydrocarbonica]|uniref:Folate-binding protein YgfZ n=1 Tax=Pseudomaricurvus hydrocarbonicus TaxID=1470433 RepID=A0A9E5MLV2_9GAMM|nr:folate-binding protein YgfZ [Aestuariicella hydrocarbonica]NHO65558.1 folate-binding protein YgfZ [Aestuariicella hydrocarbonica]
MNPDIPNLIALPHIGLLQIQGPDATKFLQGQVTNDINACTPEQWQHNAHCSPKGRMIANFDNVRIDEQTLLIGVQKDPLNALQTSLGKYIVFSKAKLADVSEHYQLVGLLGVDVTNWAKQHLGIDFVAGMTAVQKDGAVYLKRDEERIECWFPQSGSLPDALRNVALSENTTGWCQKDIELGRGWVTAATVDEFLPQFLNLQTAAINGVSFKKGCYTGQEIVARMHYKGKLKRHLYRFELSGNTPAAAGSSLFTDNSKQSAGTVVNSVCCDGKVQLLAVTTEDAVKGGALTLDQDSRDTLTLLPLPYEVE